MLVTVKLKLSTPFLGGLKPDQRSVRRLETNRGEIVVRTVFWQDQFQIAANELNYVVDAKTILPPERFRPATIHLYQRTYSRVRVESFESFRAGTVLTLDFRIQHQSAKAPDATKFLAILRLTGEKLGLSQFGSKFGFGRFEVMSITPTSSENYERPIEPATKRPINGHHHPANDQEKTGDIGGGASFV